MRSRPRRRFGKVRGLLLTLLAIAGVLVLLVVMLPTLVSLGLGHGLIRDAVQEQVNGQVQFEAVKLSWLGDQRIRGLQITEPGGRTAVDVDVDVNRGLLALVRGALASLEVKISGELAGSIEEDGTVSFTKLPRDRGKSDPNQPTTLPEQGPIDIVLAETTIRLRDERSGRELTLEDVDGRLTYAPGEKVDLQVTAATVADGTRGSMDVRLATLGLVGPRGRLTTSDATMTLNATVQSVPLIVADVGTVLDRLYINATSEDLTDALLVSIEGEASVEGQPPSTLKGDLVIEAPFTPAGEANVALDQVTGTLSGQRVPAAALRPLVAAAGIGSMLDPARDFGPSIDVEAVITSGETAPFTVTLAGERIDARLVGGLTAASGVQLDASRLRMVAQPGLVQAVAGLHADRPATIAVEIDGATLPAAEDGYAIEKLAATGTLSIEGPVTLAAAADEPPLGTIEGLQLRLETDRLGEGLSVTGNGRIESAELTIDERVTGLFDEQGALDVRGARPIGRVRLTGLPVEAIDRHLGETRGLASYDGGGVDVELTTESRDGMLAATLDARVTTGTDALVATASVVEREEGVAVSAVRVEGPVPPGILAALQAEAETPVRLLEPAPVTLTLEPFVMPGNRRDGYAWPTDAVNGRLASEALVLGDVPGLAESIGAAGLDMQLAMMPGATRTWKALGTATLFSGPIHLGELRVDLTLPADGAAPFTGSVALLEASIAAWERQLGAESMAYRRWLGGRGGLTVDVAPAASGYVATLRPQLPTLTGVFAATITDDAVQIDAPEAMLTLRKKVLAELLGGPTDDGSDGDGAAGADGVRVPNPLRLRLAIDECRVPRAMLRGEPFDSTAVKLGVRMTGGPLELVYPNGTTAALRDIEALVRSSSLADGIELRLTGRSAAGDDGQSDGNVRIDGRMTDVLDETGALALADGNLALDVAVEALPTAIVDAMGNFEGLLVAALGPRTDATIIANQFSKTGGTLDATITSPSASLSARLRGKDEALVSDEQTPLEAQLELTPPLRKRLLARLHPIFSDVRTLEQPLKLTAGNLIVPLDGQVNRLTGDLQLTVGAVELAGGSLLLGILRAFDQRDEGQTITGTIAPVRATIRDGMLQYERFAVKLDKYTLAYQGQVNLVSGELALRTEVPLEALAVTFNELEGYADKIIVPLVTSGTYDQPKTVIDPKFNLGEQAAAAGFTGALGELGKKLGEKGIPLNDILGNIFKKKKD